MQRSLALLAALLFVACSSSATSAVATDASAEDAIGDAAIVDAVDAADGATTTDCAPFNTNLSTLAGIQPGRACTAVVRLSVDTLAPDGWNFVCGKPKVVAEADAKATATASLQPGRPGPGELISAASPTDVYVYRQEPTDFGSFSVVSAQSGLLVFGVNLNYSAAAQTYLPATWRPASELGIGCGTVKEDVTTHLYDEAGDSFPATKSETDAAIAAVRATALWNAIVPMEVAPVRLQFSVDGSSKPTSKAQWYVVLGAGLGG